MFISAEKWSAMLRELREKDDEGVAKFIRKYPFSITEPWVAKKLSSWGIEGKNDLFATAFKRGKGQRAEGPAYDRIVERLMIKDAVDELKKQGKPIQVAFLEVSEEPLPVTGSYVSADRIRNMYYTKDESVTVMRETEDEIIIESFPGVARNRAGPDIYGRIEIRIPKK